MLVLVRLPSPESLVSLNLFRVFGDALALVVFL